MRLTYFLTLLKNTNCIIGNSSAGIREAPFYGVPAINIGTRQNNRFRHRSVINIRFNKNFSEISAEKFIKKIIYKKINPQLLSVSSNFKFGKKRKGDIDLLKKFDSEKNKKTTSPQSEGFFNRLKDLWNKE